MSGGGVLVELRLTRAQADAVLRAGAFDYGDRPHPPRLTAAAAFGRLTAAVREGVADAEAADARHRRFSSLDAAGREEYRAEIERMRGMLPLHLFRAWLRRQSGTEPIVGMEEVGAG